MSTMVLGDSLQISSENICLLIGMMELACSFSLFFVNRSAHASFI